jgi:hypothetical protein
VQTDGDLVTDVADAVDVAGRRETADLAGRAVPVGAENAVRAV